MKDLFVLQAINRSRLGIFATTQLVTQKGKNRNTEKVKRGEEDREGEEKEDDEEEEVVEERK